MVSSFPQAGPCICEVALRWLGSCHLYYRSTWISAAHSPGLQCGLARHTARLSAVHLQALLIPFSYDAEILKGVYCLLPIQFPQNNRNFNIQKPTGSSIQASSGPCVTENNVMSFKVEPICKHPHETAVAEHCGEIAKRDSASNPVCIF